jgi:hypothetical protein
MRRNFESRAPRRAPSSRPEQPPISRRPGASRGEFASFSAAKRASCAHDPARLPRSVPTNRIGRPRDLQDGFRLQTMMASEGEITRSRNRLEDWHHDNFAEVFIERQNNPAFASSPPENFAVWHPRRDRSYPDNVMSCTHEGIDCRAGKILVSEKAHVRLRGKPSRNSTGRARSLSKPKCLPGTDRDNSQECRLRSNHRPSSQL